MTQDVVLYDYWRSSASYRVRIALALKAIDYTKVEVNLLNQEQSAPEHVARNPQGLVPVLDIDGLRLTQSLAMIEYLEETRPEIALLPKEPAARAKARAIALAIAAEIHPVSNLNVLKRVEALAGPEAKASWNLDNIERGLAAVEALLEGHDFALGATPGMADCVIIPQLYNARRWGADLSKMPKLLRIEASAAAHPAFQQAAPAQ